MKTLTTILAALAAVGAAYGRVRAAEARLNRPRLTTRRQWQGSTIGPESTSVLMAVTDSASKLRQPLRR